MSEYGKELLEKVLKDFNSSYSKDRKIKSLIKKIKNNSTSYEDANLYSIRVGELLSKALKKHINNNTLSGNFISRELAKEILEPTLTNNYNLVAQAVYTVQENQNKASKIGLQPQIADLNTNRIDGLVNKVASYDTLEQGNWVLGEPIVNYSQAVVDDSIRKNLETYSKVGMKATITREAESGACRWCRALAGTYEYARVKATGSDVYRRHENCRCTVTYANGNKRQDVWSKTEWEVEEDKERIQKIKQLETIKKTQLRRYIAEDGHEIIDKATYNKLIKNFIKGGGIIRQDAEAVKHLEKMGASAAYISGANTILFKPNPTISDVLEEIYHFNQDKKNLFSNYDATEMFLRREIDAQEYLLSQAKKYKIPIEQLQATKVNLEMYKRLLNEYLREKL